MSFDMTVLSKENIQLLWKIRKLIRQEFSFELKISDEDAIGHLTRFETETRDPKLKHLIRTALLNLAPPTSSTLTGTGSFQASQVEAKPVLNVKRMYRGREVKV